MFAPIVIPNDKEEEEMMKRAIASAKEEMQKESDDVANGTKSGLGAAEREGKGEERNLPNKSTINNQVSDIVGSLIFEPNSNLKFDYSFSMDNDL